jgi:hypothetical protein
VPDMRRTRRGHAAYLSAAVACTECVQPQGPANVSRAIPAAAVTLVRHVGETCTMHRKGENV